MAKRRGAVRYSSRHLGYIPDTQLIAPKIKKLHADGMTISQLSARFSLSYPVIWKVINGKKKKNSRHQ